jgi:signal transduction histidine kinase
LGITREAHAQLRIDSKGWQIIRKDGTPMPTDEYASIRALRENRLIENVEMGIIKGKGEITWISVTAAPIPIEGYGVAITYGDITERKLAEEALRKSESQLRALSLELSFVEERERKRLALYLHDEIGQSLALLRMKFGSLAGVWESKFEKQNIHQIRHLLEKVIDQTHTLTFELSPPVLHQLGLEAAIEWAGEKINQDFGIEFIFSDDGMIKPLSADIKVLLFRCVRELMSNTVKHAKAKRMTVSLTQREERVFVVVEDDGVGFDMSLRRRQPEKIGFGLFSVRERLSAVGGSYEFQSEPGRGTRITLSVPLKEEMPSSQVS